MKRLIYFITIGVTLMLAQTLHAQVGVSIRILPPYPNRITDYEARPQQVLITLTNQSAGTQQIQLRASVVGDNGIRLEVGRNYKSSTPITLAPGQVRNLNGADLVTLFDYNSLTYTGITKDQFIRGNGLPEGSYQVCMRAYDYNTNAPISADEPIGCSNRFSITSLEPPLIIKPTDGEELKPAAANIFTINWTTPPGAPPSIRYKVRLIEVLGNRNPNDAYLSAVPPYFFEKEVMGNVYVYNPADPQLTLGRKYVLAVQAFDPNGGFTFRNNGISQVVPFVYGEAIQVPINSPVAPQQVPPSPPNVIAAIPDCGSCKSTAPAGNTNNALAEVGKEIKVGKFLMRIVTLASSGNKLSGTGTINLPFIGSNTPGARLKVQFSDVEVNSNLEMKAGLVSGITATGASSFIPANSAGQAPVFGTQQATDLTEYFTSNASQTIQSVRNSANASGFELPLALSTGLNTLAITKVYFNAEQAWFEAAGAVAIPEDNSVLPLAGRNICLSATDLCENGVIYLSDNFKVNALNLTLRTSGGNLNTDPGTSLTFNKNGMVNLTIDADYTFPNRSVIDAQSGQALTARLKAVTEQGWQDWIAELSMPKFKIGGLESIAFETGQRPIYFDHSDFKNPEGIPSSFTSADAGESPINTSLPTWQGIYIPKTEVHLPEIIKNANGQALKMETSNIIIDANGLTGAIQNSGTVLTIGEGSMDGWYASIEKVTLNIFKSAFKSSTMTGKLVLPASTDYANASNQLDYTAELATPNDGGLAYQFKIHPKDNLVLNALFMQVNLDSRTEITVSGGGGNPLVARANLNGSLTISNDPMSAIKIPGVGKLKMLGVGFENLKLMTVSPFIDKEGMKIYFASEQRKLAGFDYSAKFNGWELSGSEDDVTVALPFEGNIKLAGEALGCEAKAVFALTSGIKKANNRIVWTGVGGEIRDISFGGEVQLGAFSLRGAIKYYNNKSNSGSDEGFVGALETNLAGFLQINMRGRFGVLTDAQGDFNYYDFNALADFGQAGITFAPPIPLAIYGFGGGFSYNMDIDKSSVPSIDKVSETKQAEPSKESSALDLLNYNPAGLRLTPKRGAMTLQATLLFGLTSRNTLDADATFSMGFNTNGGLNFVRLNGNARILTDVSKPLATRREASTGAGSLEIEFVTETHAFLANLEVEMGVPTVANKSLLHAKGGATFFSNGEKWYFKIGSPSIPNTIRFLNFVEGTSYFQIGNTGIEDMPRIPQWIEDIVGHGGKNQSSKLSESFNVASNQSKQNRSNSGMIFGAASKFGDPDKRYQFLMFYGEFAGALGFDFALKDNYECNNLPKSGGAGGWYATGQAYFGAKAAVGISVDMFLVKGDFEIFSAGAAATVKAGFPDPIYAKGALGAHFRILDGLIDGDFNLQFSIGQECINSEAQAFGGLEIISQVLPEKSSEKVPLNIVPAVTFNLSIGGQFAQYDSYQPGLGMYAFDDYENPTKDGMPTRRYFLFDRSCLTVTLNGEDVTNRLARYKGDKKTLYLPTETHLPKNTKFNFKVVARMKEAFLDQAAFINSMGGDGSALAQFRFIQLNGRDATQDAETEFTTDEGYGNIQASDYAVTWPMHGHTAVPFKESGIEQNAQKMYIETRKVVDNHTYFKYPEGTTYKARIFRNGVKVGADIDVDMQTVNTYINTPYTGHQRPHTRWSWAAPELLASTDYVAIVVAKIPAGNSSPNVNTRVSNTTFVSTQALSAGAINTRSTALSGNMNNNELRAGESIAASFAFKTSRHNTYNAKLSDAKISKITHADKGGAISSANSTATNLNILNSWITPQNGIYKIILGMGSNLEIDVTLNGEKFNKADVESTTSDQVFLASSASSGGNLVNPRLSPITLEKLYKNPPFANFGADNDLFKQYLSDRTGVAKARFAISNNPVPTISGNGILDTWARTDGGVSFINSFTVIGAVLPTDVPKPPSNQATQVGQFLSFQTFTVPMVTPTLLERIRNVSIGSHSVGMPSFTNPVQIVIDRVTNWSVNWGNNQQAGAPQAGISNMGATSTWEGISQMATGVVNGTSTLNQLQNGLQGLKGKGAIR